MTIVHKNGLLHRDIKPQNIILRSSNNDAVLIDFGIARHFTPDLTQRHTEFLTPGFAPIEQYFGRSRRGAYTDVYAIAATLYAVLTGKTPPCALDRDYETQNFGKDPLVPPKQINLHLSDKVNQAILKEMEIKPENCPQSIQDWLALLPLSNDTPLNLPTMVGTWLGNFGTRDKPATLIVTQQSGYLFNGTLIVKDSKVDWTYCINVKGHWNSENNQISILEHHVLSEPWWCSWRRGENEGTLTIDGKRMSGTGKDSQESYSWSFIRIDYTNLTNLLELGNWKEADRETGTLMLRIACQEQLLSSQAIKYFPCQELCTIDQLWVNYRKGHFGFSVQRQIWE
ncbi:MAG: GUN4 domain-containing protein, partial [Chroococcidiopsidaceae cyanobacterium CP_BM_ER_R8_30]|nr:GUN4 domain-containing protein [Chroococcidiopsidaceae cyanobacterium CP_BM_ER_R8_30]